MVKTKRKVEIGFVIILSIIAELCAGVFSDSHVKADEVTFTANVVESLSVTITQPGSWAKGDAGDFLTDKIELTVTSNNSGGYTASMYSESTTNLTHASVSSASIPTLQSNTTRGEFPTDFWGFSLLDTDEGLSSAAYRPMVQGSASPIYLNSHEGVTSEETTNIYFGTKASLAKAAGTYSNKVIISVVSGIVQTNPTIPEDPTPATPDDDTDPTDHTPTYRPSADDSVYVNPDEPDNTQVIAGNYTGPLGVTENTYYTSNVSTGSSLATGLAVASATAATTGLLFFVLAKRRNDDEDDDGTL